MLACRCLIASLLAGLTLAAGVAPAHAARPTPSLLFVQQSRGGTLERVGAGTYRLTLRDVAPSVSAFADRPARTASSESAARFVTRWSGRGFTADPPNAALTVAGAPPGRDVLMLTLRRPRYDRRARTFTYLARPMRGTPGAALRAFHARRDPVRELRFGAASLFIDDASPLVAQQMLMVFGGDRDTNVYSVELTPQDGWDIAFAASTPGSPAVQVLDDGTLIQATSTPTTVSFTVDQVDGAYEVPVAVTLVGTPTLGRFLLRNTSSSGVVGLTAYQSFTGQVPFPIQRTATEVYWGIQS